MIFGKRHIKNRVTECHWVPLYLREGWYLKKDKKNPLQLSTIKIVKCGFLDFRVNCPFNFVSSNQHFWQHLNLPKAFWHPDLCLAGQSFTSLLPNAVLFQGRDQMPIINTEPTPIPPSSFLLPLIWLALSDVTVPGTLKSHLQQETEFLHQQHYLNSFLHRMDSTSIKWFVRYHHFKLI